MKITKVLCSTVIVANYWLSLVILTALDNSAGKFSKGYSLDAASLMSSDKLHQICWLFNPSEATHSININVLHDASFLWTGWKSFHEDYVTGMLIYPVMTTYPSWGFPERSSWWQPVMQATSGLSHLIAHVSAVALVQKRDLALTSLGMVKSNLT